MTSGGTSIDLAELSYHDGYLPIEDHGLIGDGSTAALVARDGRVSWLCAPRFDSEPLFCSLLDNERGGSFLVAPDGLVAARQHYEPDTGVLVTEMQAPGGVVRTIDCLTFQSGADLAEDVKAARGELLRSVEVVSGEVDLLVEVAPRGGADAVPTDGGLRIRSHRQPQLPLQLSATRPLTGLRQRLSLRQGDRLDLLLRWAPGHRRPRDCDQLLESTRAAWRRWADHIDYDGPRRESVRRSALTLKMLDHFEGGPVVAAPTSSLPEAIGGMRNWDYRFAWVRDAAFSVYALRRVGLGAEAWGFLGWVLDAIERDGQARVLYDLDGSAPPPERIDEELEGYRRSAPVRWGNGAASQRQHDAYGEILDCAFQWASGGGSLESMWPRLRALVEEAAQRWSAPDHGIWEVRTSGRVFTYSAAMCQVALDRGARLAAGSGLPGDHQRWEKEAARIASVIVEEAWNERDQTLTENLGGHGGVDASLLALPLRRVVDANHPAMTATVEAVQRRLGAGSGLLYRYLPDESPDGIPGDEGAFLLCSFWLVDNLAYQGRLDEAVELFESLCGRTNPLGLLPEEIDPTTGSFLGNYPQAFSHVGLISSGINLHRHTRQAQAPQGQ